MTAAELIAMLLDLPPDTMVFTWDGKFMASPHEPELRGPEGDDGSFMLQ